MCVLSVGMGRLILCVFVECMCLLRASVCVLSVNVE